MWLSVERSVFWEEQKALIVSDLHFGKTGHFRKSGVAVPQTVYKEDLQRLVTLLNHFKPEKLIVVGDFFHSHANNELDWFRKWRENFPLLKVLLIKGNHDILKKDWYQQSDIEVINDRLLLDPFLFIHDKCEDDKDNYVFCGHLHPGIIIGGLAKQSLRFPCFYFTETHAVLPAFSRFAGMAIIDPRKNEKVFAIVENKLVAIK